MTGLVSHADLCLTICIDPESIVVAVPVGHPERIEKLILVSVSNDFRLSPLLRFTFRLPTAWLEPVRSLVRRQLSAPAYVLKSSTTPPSLHGTARLCCRK